MNKDILNMNISFSKDIFMKEDFDVDRFLEENCSETGLHKLHKELGIFVKNLQLMMIDIVNAESNVIINLSSDLKVLQNKFLTVSAPLERFKEEITQIFNILDAHLTDVEQLLKEKENVTLMKSSKINELRVLISSQKIGRILLPFIKSTNIDLDILERSVDQYILQQMYCQNCNTEDLKLQINFSTNILNKILNNMFLNSLTDKNTDSILRCLQMYMLINNQTVAENLYRIIIVRPALKKIINIEMLTALNNDLSKLYNKLIDFVNNDMNLLLNTIHKSNSISGFNFILNSAWLEIHEQLKLNLSVLYAPGDPVVFHLRFLQTCDFFSNLEKCFLDEKQRLQFLQHPSYSAHKNQWNLPVYYGIRHLEIVHNLEKYFPTAVSNSIFNKTELSGWKLITTNQCWKSMQRCFEPDVFLPQLIDRFWKLNLHIIARYITWAQFLLKKNIPIKEDLHETDPEQKSLIDLKIKFLIYMYLDILLLNNKFENAFSKNGLTYLISIHKHLQEFIIKSLTDPINQFQNILHIIENVIVNSVYMDCSVHVKQILQIPRLFRKTNRSTPLGPSTYLTSMWKPINNFKHSYEHLLDEKTLFRILREIHLKIIEEYKTLVEKVLVSVAKTEESLKRLKKIKNGSGHSENIITDDQKIRMQVHLDIKYYCNEAQRYTDVKELLCLSKETDIQ